MVLCPNCGKDNMSGSNICVRCGKDLMFTDYGIKSRRAKPDLSQGPTRTSGLVETYSSTTTGSTLSTVWTNDAETKSLAQLIEETGLDGDFFMRAYRDGILQLAYITAGIPFFKLTEEGRNLIEYMKKDKKKRLENW